jgi:hypothetical protein
MITEEIYCVESIATTTQRSTTGRSKIGLFRPVGFTSEEEREIFCKEHNKNGVNGETLVKFNQDEIGNRTYDN